MSRQEKIEEATDALKEMFVEDEATIISIYIDANSDYFCFSISDGSKREEYQRFEGTLRRVE